MLHGKEITVLSYCPFHFVIGVKNLEARDILVGHVDADYK